LFKFMTGVDMVHVPYRGAAPVLSDLLAGQVQATFSPIGSSLAYIQAGKLRALAVTSPQRVQTLPDVPTVAEYVPGYAATASDGLGAPKSTPDEILDVLNKEVNAAISDPEIKARLAKLGSEPTPLTRGAFKSFLAEETEKWAKVVKFAGIKPA
jgi:tripartite-type tricarboxylate transporter receptor subunit TctC